MKREFLKGFTMSALLLTLALTTAVVANAQSTANKIVASVPFEFSVGYKALPAGEYTVRSIASANNGLLIQSSDGKTSALRLSEATRRIKDRPRAHLVFHKYGERYFLAEVWNGIDNTGRQLLRSREESAIEDELRLVSSRENAHASSTVYEIVEVAAILR